jgi:hypothetical protein
MSADRTKSRKAKRAAAFKQEPGVGANGTKARPAGDRASPLARQAARARGRDLSPIPDVDEVDAAPSCDVRRRCL